MWNMNNCSTCVGSHFVARAQCNGMWVRLGAAFSCALWKLTDSPQKTFEGFVLKFSDRGSHMVVNQSYALSKKGTSLMLCVE